MYILYMYIDLHIYIYIYIHTHTHTHTHAYDVYDHLLDRKYIHTQIYYMYQN